MLSLSQNTCLVSSRVENAAVLSSSVMIHILVPTLTAYMIPIVVGVIVMGADEVSTFLGAAIIAVTNLLIHTPQVR